MKRKILSILLAAALTAALTVPAFAWSGDEMAAADELYSLGLFKGTGEGYALDRAATRQEAAVMLVKLLGRQNAALTGHYSHPFSDVDAWADDYVGYCYQKKLVSGYDKTHFGGGDSLTAAQYLTYILRVLGYGADSDFNWSSPWALAEKLGLIDAAFTRSASAPCTRGMLALITDSALKARFKGTSDTLGEYLQTASKTSETPLTGAEIARKCSGAVFYMTTYVDTDCKTQYGSASGFFISADGVAVTNYHAIRDHYGAKATLVSGETYPVLGVISADPTRDLAVIRIGRTAESGGTIAKFPYLTLGRSALLEEGGTVYAIGSPLAQSNTMTSGIVSNAWRVVDSDPPYIQTSAATAVGSSGGALLNDQGQVVGVCTAILSNGDDMTLAVPIDALSALSKTGTVYSLYDYSYKQSQVVRDTLCSITAGSAEITVPYHQSGAVVITTDCVSDFYMGIESADPTVAIAQWGTQIDKYSCTLLITGLAKGTTTVTVKFLSGYGNPDAAAVITVHVV
ncbi:MAG TPA: trypsin-like peptidase domain-containing protein [Oscillospiraceae bacterium]|nr:trypsin-like peptidase domain-containing protein [Oscillospiraceae bacterium]